MNDNELANALAVYRSGLETELALLRQIRRLAAGLQDSSANPDFTALNHIVEERDRLMASLVSVEHEIGAIRLTLAAHQREAATIEGFDDVVALHRAASHLVSAILSCDEETLQALRDAELARRLAAQTIEAGEHTLAAYRRVIAPPLANAALVDKRG